MENLRLRADQADRRLLVSEGQVAETVGRFREWAALVIADRTDARPAAADQEERLLDAVDLQVLKVVIVAGDEEIELRFLQQRRPHPLQRTDVAVLAVAERRM